MTCNATHSSDFGGCHPVVLVRGSTREAVDPTAAVAIVVGVLAVRNAVGEWLVPPVLYVPVNTRPPTALRSSPRSAARPTGASSTALPASPITLLLAAKLIDWRNRWSPA
jgi:hypothetical protein